MTIYFEIFDLKKTIGLISTLAFAIVITGCDREKVLEEVSNFDNAVTNASEVTSAYYTNLNEMEFKLYFELLKLNPEYEVGDRIRYVLSDENGQEQEFFLDSPLKQPPFPLEAIQLRIELLKALSNYGKNLALVAGDESPEEFAGNITALKDRLVSLEKSFSRLRTKEENPDSQAGQYLEPISSIVGFLGKLILTEIQWEAVQDAVIDAEEPVNIILDGIIQDLDAYVDPVQNLALNDLYTTLIDYYNQNRRQLSQQQREVMLNRIRERKNAYDYALLYKPSAVPKQLKQVHLALVNTVESDGDVADLAQLKAEFDRFDQVVKRLQTGLEQIAGEE